VAVPHQSSYEKISYYGEYRGSGKKLSGTVVLGNPDASEIELPILNAKASGNVVEFETSLKADTFYWSLTVKKPGDRGLLHGSCREMLIDESVVKQH
jgi:hypothetical protein